MDEEICKEGKRCEVEFTGSEFRRGRVIGVSRNICRDETGGFTADDLAPSA